MAKQKDRGLRRGQGYTEIRTDNHGVQFVIARWPEAGKYPSKVFRHEDIAVAVELGEQHIRERRSLQRKIERAPHQMTIEDVINQYLERGEQDWKPGTYVTYVKRANSYVFPLIGNVRLAALTTPQLQHWIDTLRREGRSAETIYAASALITSAMREAVRLGLIDVNPATGLKLPRIGRPDHVTWSMDDIGNVFEVLGDQPMWNALYRLMVATGLRPGEVRALQWDDIDVDRRHMTIRRTMTKDRQGREVVGSSTKTGDPRRIAVPDVAIEALIRWRTEQKVVRLAAKRWTNSGHVFTSRHGEELSASVWQRMHRQICTEAGVPVITLHELRHTHATIELEAGTHPKIVQERLGHKRIHTTLDTYSHLSDDLQRAAADSLSDRLLHATTSTRKTVGKS